MTELFRAIISDLCSNLTQVLQIPQGDDRSAEELEEATKIMDAAKKSLTAAQKALETASYYTK